MVRHHEHHGQRPHHHTHRHHHPHHHTDSDDSPSSTSTSLSSETTRMGLDPGFLSNPQEKGRVFNVAYARSYNGKDAGEVVVAKWVRESHGNGCKEDHVKDVMRNSAIADAIIREFVETRNTAGWTITINRPVLMQTHEKGPHNGKFVLVEPYISKYKKFNSNAGWVLDSNRTYNKILQALSHYSYVFSSREYILCDLQGGIVEEDKHIKLTDVAIVSKKGNKYGCADIGKRGINDFFRYHKCNEYCKNLPTSKKQKLIFTPVRTTKTFEF